MPDHDSKQFAIGVDFGTSSCRAVVVDTADGSIIGEATATYAHGIDGTIVDASDPNLARQHPQDYFDAFTSTVTEAVNAASATDGFSPDKVVGIGTDATGSTPVPVDASGTPLALLDEFKDNPHAMAWLWKDHTAHAEAIEITELAKRRGEPYLDACGGAYSSEWFWSKILRCKRVAPDVYNAVHSWVEQQDIIPAWAAGELSPATVTRGLCAAGHKCMFADRWGGLPSTDFLAQLDADLPALRDRLFSNASSPEQKIGGLNPQLAAKVGLPAGIPISAGGIDAHVGAIGSGVQPGVLVRIVGTSTCDITVSPQADGVPSVPGICGYALGSVLPNHYGLEAGQSAVGDIFNWFVKNLSPAQFGSDSDAHIKLTEGAAHLAPGESGLLALDWNNGNRSVLTDPKLTGLILGQTLSTTAPEMYRALIEATAFGARRIIEQFVNNNVKIDRVINCGGIAEKNAFLMQTYADIIGLPMEVAGSPQTCALGAAILGAVTGGAHETVEVAQAAMVPPTSTTYTPNVDAHAVYNKLYDLYLQLHDGFGIAGGDTPATSMANVMKALIDIRKQATRS